MIWAQPNRSITQAFAVRCGLTCSTVKQDLLASPEVVEFVGERRAEATVGESGAGAPRC